MSPPDPRRARTAERIRALRAEVRGARNLADVLEQAGMAFMRDRDELRRVLAGMEPVLLFAVEVVDLAPEAELVGRWGVLRRAFARYLAGAPLDEDELRALLRGREPEP